ncbi:E3 ubiquitin-protein ligase lubel isoform X3 [Topomyia yanbarensis]|nr:E3 ubiquitin-protein ligase lubel isoform X3 [Topomyia yanbarensis]
MANHPASRFKTSRTMPTWVTDSSDRVGPPPPAPPNNHDPEYEVIDVANQQYSNAPPPIPLKSPDIKRMTVMKCDLCGSVTPAVRCIQCDQNLFCASCDERYHRHPKRQTHTRTPVELQNTTVKPPLPPKGEASTGGPLPPPRRTKRPGSFLFPSPMLGRKQEPDQTIPTTVPQGPEVSQPQKPPQPPPSPALSLRDKMSSLKRFIHPSNRPLPDPPGQKVHSSNTSLNSTGASPFRSISSTMEKIQNNTAATLDRMTLLQQRYRQHQETMKADSDRSRRASVSSNVDLQSSGPNIRSKPPSVPTINHHHQQQQFHQQHLLHPRWNEPPTPRIRSGSVASDINLLPSASSTVSNESNPPRNNPPFMSPMQRSEFGAVPGSGPPNPRSTSVFNINQLQPQQPNMWGFTPLQQAQSMAHFNQMHWNQMNPWMPGQSQNGSNMSLNLPPSQMSHYPHDQPGYPSNWNNAWGGMYPYPMGMMPVMPGMALPPPRSRAHSRSRAASPALSIKSRKSTMSMRNMQRSSYINDLTDDEDSDEEFIKPRGRRDRRQRVDSNSSLDFDEPEPNTFIRASSVKHSRFNRDRRSGSAARSLIDYPTSHTRESHRTRYDRDELLRDRFDKMSLSSTRKTTNPSQGNDSDKEFNRNVSKQARSNNEDIGSPRKITSDSMTNDSDVDLERRRLAKHRTSSSAASPRRIASDSFTNDSDADSQRRKQQSKKSNKPTIPLPKRMESDSVTNDSDSIREKSKPFGIKKESDTEKNKSSKSTKSGQIIPKKIPSDSHTPDTDGEQRRRFNNKKSLKKHSSTEFIANDSDAEFERRKQEKLKKASVQELPEDKCSKISDDEEQETHMKTVELKNQLNETKLESIEVTVDTLPISAVAPNREWECEFCTYVNDAGVKICAICCKTVSAIITETKANTNMPRSPPPDVVQEPPFEKKLVSRPIDDVQKQEKISPVPTKEGEAKKKDNDDEKENGDDGGTNSVNEKVFDESQYENHEFNMQCSPSRSGCLKDSGEIKQNLDSEEVKIVNKLVKEKVSTGCGPSPPRESQKEPLKLQDNRQPTTPRASIGTSPPPQDMSTQTYDSFEQISEDISASQVIAQDKLPNNLTQPPPGSIFKRSHSIATTPQLLQVGGSRSGSRMSFSSDTQSLPPSPHEQSPQPPQQAQYHDTPQAIPNHSDENMSYLDRAIHQIIQTAAKTTFSLSRPLDQNKYRAMNDLRRIDVIQPNHPTAKDLLPNRQMTNTTMCDRSDDATRMMETLKIDGHTNLAGAELVYLLKEAEQHKFTAEELQAALGHCRDKHPIQWLHDNWSKLIDTVQTLATKYGHEKRENTIGTISSIEAREALRLHKGNIWHAITECIEQRQKKYNEIASKGNFTREDIVTSLTAHHGNLDLAMVELSKTQLKPFLMRIWGPPNGADNDSGNSLLQQALKEDRSGISSEIQEFISTHVENELLSNGSSNGVHAVNACSEKLEESKKITNRCPTTNGRAAMKPEDIQKFGNQGVSNDNPTVIDDECIPSNTAILRDIEKLIDQMEKNQANQNEDVLKNIQQLLTKLVDRNESRPASQVSVRSESCERIITKSPIPLRRSTEISIDETKPIYEDIRKFMTDNIQEILPSLVGQVQQELDSTPFRSARTLEDDIRETLMNAEYSEDDYATIHCFPFKRDPETARDFPSLTKITSKDSNTTQEEDNEYANIQNFLRRAIRNERLTCNFEQYRMQNYRFDSSSDEAKMTAESTDYYDIVTVNQKIQEALDRRRTSVKSETESMRSESISLELDALGMASPIEEAIYANVSTIKSTISAVESNENIHNRELANNELREPTKCSSQMDLKATIADTVIPVIYTDNFEGLKLVVENIQKDEQAFEMLPVEPVSQIDNVEEFRHAVGTIEEIQDDLEMSLDKQDTSLLEADLPINDNVTETDETVIEILPNHPPAATATKPATTHYAQEVSENAEIEPQDHITHAHDSRSNANDSNASASNVDVESHELVEVVPTSVTVLEFSGQLTTQDPISPNNADSTHIKIITIPSQTQLTPSGLTSDEQALSTDFSVIPVQSNASLNQIPSPPRTPEVEAFPKSPTAIENETSQIPSQDLPTSSTLNGTTTSVPCVIPTSPEDKQSNHPSPIAPNDNIVTTSLSKPSNNLSDLVLDTKRLIQQMKDEIASDMATMQNEDEIYDGEYYEEDEYDEWSDENIDEWESNEEYDVDENGDYYEYEDEDEDGSVMFSEIAPEDAWDAMNRVSEPADQVMIEEAIGNKLDLPKISAALIRELERNSASEVSDLPLDSDFNDALSIIEQSVGEVDEILSSAVEGLMEIHHSEYDEIIGPGTLQNSPDASEFSEMTLIADRTESTEATLVAEENLNYTRKNVQTLLNAKAVIGNFIRTAQLVEDRDIPTLNGLEGQIVVATDEENQPSKLNQCIVLETSQTDHADVHQRTTELVERSNNNNIEESVNETVHTEKILRDSIELHPDQEVADATHVLDATIEMLNSVARDLSEQLRQVSPSQDNTRPGRDPEEAVIMNSSFQQNIPEYAVVTRNRTTGSVEISGAIPLLPEAEIHDYVNVYNGRVALMDSGITDVIEQHHTSVPSDDQFEAIPNSIPEYATVIKVNNELQLIEEPPTILEPESSINSSVNVQNVVNRRPETTRISAIALEYKENRQTNTESKITETVEETNSTAAEVLNRVQTNQAIPTSHDLTGPMNKKEETHHIDESIPKDTSVELVQPVIENTDSTQHAGSNSQHNMQPIKSIQSDPIQSISNGVVVNDIASIDDIENRSKNYAASGNVNLQTEIISEQKIIEQNHKESEVNVNESPNGNSSDPNLGQASASKMNTITIIHDQPNITSIDKNKQQTSTITAVEQPSSYQNEQTYSITNGDLQEATLHSSRSREPSEELSSFIEVQPSQVIIHKPSSEIQDSQSLPEPPQQSSNIDANLEVSQSNNDGSKKSGKLSLKIPKTIVKSENATTKKPSTPPSPPSPSSSKITKTVKTKPKTTTDTKKKSSTASDSSSRRNSLRKTSIGGPFGPVQTNTVKNMQKEFLSKTHKDTSKSVISSAPKPKPSKLVQPKAFTNKLTKPVTSNQPLNGTDFSKASTPSTEPGSSRSTPGPSSGNSIGSREGSVTSEQKRKLRKKYLETCFSDDYMTSDEDGDLTTVTESESRTIIRSLVTPYEPSEEPIEVQARRMLDEGHVQTYQQAELAVQLIEMRYARDNAIWAATQCHTIDEAKDLLQKECELCLGVYPMNEIISMLKCTHSCCLDCTKVYFTEEIMHRSITNCNCPYCKEPDLNNSNVTEDDVLEYFSNLDILLKNIVDEEVHDLFQRKLRDRTLMQDPNFKWCVNCSSGFFVRPRQKRLICPDCGSITCTSCRKPWEPQHEGISCEKFAEWKEANDPEFQAQGVARHLQAHGISCPNCNFKYSLSRGGCMHFTCIQCKFEFCFGCNKPFMMGAKCNVSPYCAKLGLHAHHPRNCLFYLRDKDPRDLQTLLTMHNVTFDTEPSELLKREFRQSELDSMKCPIPLQKETPAGLMDTVCNNDVPEAHAGLCRTHYVEYLVGAVSKAQIDPLPILDLTDCVQELRRRGIPLPERGPWDTDEIYREMCQKIVKEQIPLN